MQAFMLKVVQYLGYQFSKKIIELLKEAIYTAYKDRVIAETERKLEITQEERRAIINSISRATTNEERRTLSIMLSKFTN